MVANRNPFTDPGESDILGKTMFSDRYYLDLDIKYQDEKIYLILENFFLESLLCVPVSISSFCDQPVCFLDPYSCLRPVFSKSFWGKRYHGSQPLYEYLTERGAKSKSSYNYLPVLIMMEFWLQGTSAHSIFILSD